MARRFQIALVGAGMFGGDVHLRTYADFVRRGIAPDLGRVAMDDFARHFADVEIELVAVGTRTPQSAENSAETFHQWTGQRPREFSGETPWEGILDAFPDLDLLAVATPDHLHAEPMLAALKRGVHVAVEKPMTLKMDEADAVIEAAKASGCIVGLDMHKRYDPDHLKIYRDLIHRIGTPLYGRAVLEEPLEVSTKTFKWVRDSDPFSYVGVHWTDLFIHYLQTKPRSLFAVGQKRKLREEYGIDAWDAVQVSVVFDTGLHIQFNNHWICPPEFEGPVNQESELVATRGKVESDSQYRGLRFVIEDDGSRTSNTHMTRQVQRPDGSYVTIGYGKDSLVVCVLAAMRRKFDGTALEALRGTYPDADEGRLSVAIIEAAQIVRDHNFEYFAQGLGTPVTARFGDDGITIYDPVGETARIYDRAI
ncbi:MAG: Gfo/Idh/MocA family oxidoreductase [Candidatus Poribacteria bacterium]|nr:Gfo/Idh/MocA family oxidoreductase [Candidatus Poribacteria bacterium]